MIIIVKMRRRGFVMIVLFCLNCRDEKCRHRRPVLVLVLNERERERLTHPSARTTAARGGAIVREKERERKNRCVRKRRINWLFY